MTLIERTKHDIYPFISHADGLKDSAKGKTVLVTGGGTGIGKAIATHFALAGAQTVIIIGRNTKTLQEAEVDIRTAAPECTVISIPADISDEKSVQKLFDALPKVPDVLVNNAGVSVSVKSIVESNIKDWWLDQEINLKGTYICSRAFLIALAGKPGVIIILSSGGAYNTLPNMSSYNIAKTSVTRLADAIDCEHSSQGVLCYALHPGGVLDTVMGGKAPDMFKKYLVDSADLSAGTALYLSTPRASFLSGRFVWSNWDMEQLEDRKEKIVEEGLFKMGIGLGGEMLKPVVSLSK